MGYEMTKEERKWLDMQENPPKPQNKILFSIGLVLGYTLEAIIIIPLALLFGWIAIGLEKIAKRAYKE